MKPVTATFSLLASAAALAVMTSLTIANAEAQTTSDGQGFSFAFAYSADELATQDGARRVYDRLETAVRRSCRDAGHLDVIDTRRIESCVAANINSAVKQIGNPVLASLADGASRS